MRPGTFQERKDDSNVARISFPKNLLWGDVIDSLNLKYLLFHGHSRPSFPQPIHSQQPSTLGSLNQDPQKLPSSLMEAFSELRLFLPNSSFPSSVTKVSDLHLVQRLSCFLAPSAFCPPKVFLLKRSCLSNHILASASQRL